MECGEMDKDWIISENSPGQCLQELRRVSLINYLTESITPFTYEDILKNKEEEFLKDFGDIEKLKIMYNQDLEEFGHKYPFKSFEQYKHYYIGNYYDTLFYFEHSKDDVYNYTSQKYAIDILARFSQFKQVAFIPEDEIESNQYPDIEVYFVDKENVGRFQVHFKMIDRCLSPDFLNTNPIKLIKKCHKVPVLTLDKFKCLLPLRNPIEFYPYYKNKNEEIFPTSLHDKFRDSKGNEKDIFLSNCLYVLKDRDSQPYRRIPILDIIKPHLERMDFSRGEWPFLADTYGSGRNRNGLLHKYNQEKEEIQFRLCARDSSESNHYEYTVFDVKIKLCKDLTVKICENTRENFIVDPSSPF